MKLSERWLREWANPNISTQALADSLTFAGLEVSSLSPVAGVFTSVVVGQIISAVQHPNADRLRVCEVSIGDAPHLQIVCGAPNARVGIKVAAALVGAVLPGDFQIKEAKLRGVESMGMLCSFKELGMSDESQGIIEFPEDAPVGQSVADYLKTQDTVVEIELTPNRADCLSVMGLAREISVLHGLTLNSLDVQPVPVNTGLNLSIQVDQEKFCPAYTARVIRGLNNQGHAPLWMRECLRRSGTRSISKVVDVTNYVLLLLGQPLHAFDRSKVEGGMVVRLAHPGETLTLLDQRSVTLKPQTLVIADHSKALALAGVMGGLASGVSEQTTEIILECAYFTPEYMAGKSREYLAQTDSAYRYERGIDVEKMDLALEYASRLIIDLCGGEAGPKITQASAQYLPVPAGIDLPLNLIARYLSLNLDPNWISNTLTQLGFTIQSQSSNHWTLKAPSYRHDVRLPEDVVEELARIYGYDRLPARMPLMSPVQNAASETTLSLVRLKQLLVDRAYHEAITYSFIDPKMQALFFGTQEAPVLKNPISAQLSVMRSSILPGLLSAVQYNLHRQQERVRLFEVGTCFELSDKPQEGFRELEINDRIQSLREFTVLSGAICGSLEPIQWRKPEIVNFYTLKSDVEAILSSMGMLSDCQFKPSSQYRFSHPGQTAEIWSQDQCIGMIGALHPTLQAELELKPSVYVFELKLDALMRLSLPGFKSISKFPSIRRDLALLVRADLSYAELEANLRNSACPHLKDFWLFDVYQGPELGADKKSLAIALNFQDDSATLTEAQISSAVQFLLAHLKDTCQVELRS